MVELSTTSAASTLKSGVDSVAGFTGESPAVRVEHVTYSYPVKKSRSRDDFKKSGPNSWSSSSAPREFALDDVTLDIASGEVFAVLGPNGGGKSTLFRLLATLAVPSRGKIILDGLDVSRQPDQVRQRIGVVFQAPSLDIKLSAYENLLHQGHLYGLRGEDLQSRIEAALKTVGLQERYNDLAETFSGGMKRRLEIAKALLHKPSVLLLDEPTTGLDPGARRELWAALIQMRQTTGLTIALTTHLMDEADRCDRVAILNTGKLVALDTPTGLKARVGADVLSIIPIDGTDSQSVAEILAEIMQAFGPWTDLSRPALVDGAIRLQHPDGATLLPKIGSLFPDRFQSMSVSRPTLEDVFHLLTGQTL